jgi:hypothetical protein
LRPPVRDDDEVDPVWNILVAAEQGAFVGRALGDINSALRPFVTTLVKNATKARDRITLAAFHQAQIEAILAQARLPANSSLSVIAVELLPGGTIFEPKNPNALAAASTPVSGTRRPVER